MHTFFVTTALILSFLTASSADRTLAPYAFPPMPLGQINPRGWLSGELTTLATGLAGHEALFYPYVNASSWTGGSSEYSALNEGLPYWFNGLVALAYTLPSADLQTQVQSAADFVLSRAEASADGWIGPEPTDGERNFWGRMPFLLGLVSLAQADNGWTDRVVAALWRYFGLVNTMLNDGGSGYTDCGLGVNDCSWGQVRVGDMLVAMQWLLETHPRANATDALWASMDMLHNTSQYKWEDWYQPGTYQQVVADPTPSNPDFPFLHGVNVGQGLKSPAVLYRLTSNAIIYPELAMRAVNWTFLYHGAPSGSILGDEIVRDLAPWSGSELCTAVETAYSLAYLYQTLGNNSFADHAERVVFNAMPVMLTEDSWAHQYMAEPNQPWALNLATGGAQSVFTTSDAAATVFGLEPEYPCCTVNHPQGWPKFVANSWSVVDTGVVHALLAPSEVDATTGAGTAVNVVCDTDYPFSNVLTYTITAEDDVDLFLRLPEWAGPGASTVVANGVVQPSLTPDRVTGLHKVAVPAGQSTVVYTIEMVPRAEMRSTGAVSVLMGNLLYALDVGGNVTSSLPHRYWDPGTTTDEFAEWPQVRDYYFNYTLPVSCATHIHPFIQGVLMLTWLY